MSIEIKIEELTSAVQALTVAVLAASPKAEAPKAKAPKAEAPKVEVPKAEVPKAEAPKAEVPTVETVQSECLKLVRTNPSNRGRIKALLLGFDNAKTVAQLSPEHLVEFSNLLHEVA